MICKKKNIYTNHPTNALTQIRGAVALFLLLKPEKKCWTSASQPQDVGPFEIVKNYFNSF